jgi:hypothetical protein
MAIFQRTEPRWCPRCEHEFLATVIEDTGSDGRPVSEVTPCDTCGMAGQARPVAASGA